MKKIFISQPMKSKTVEEIKEERAALVAEIEARGDCVIESVMDTPPDMESQALWCLGRSLEILAGCDEAVFMPGWWDARGCKMEYQVCLAYGIPVNCLGGALPNDAVSDGEEVQA
ncbi:MAG: DUF4406 domain-containing protein [Christensenellaceae bacterium]|jgi:hypothetical protein|nr:DUF4406 domain-containing protein [Christensenellaceae bacterium]